MSSQPIRYGIIGLGRAGWGIHVEALRGRDGAQIVAVADGVEQRREEAKAEFGCQTHESIEGVLDHEDVDVVVVATPSVVHAANTIDALAAGKHVACEKPMAMSVVEADAMIEAAEKADRKLFIHQNYRLRPEAQYLIDVVRSGLIGRLYHVRCYLSGFTRRNDWQTLAKNGGGVLNNTFPHFLDIVLQLTGGTVTDVFGDLQLIASGGDVEDHVKGVFRTDNVCTADLEISCAQQIEGPLPRWILCGSNGTLTSDGATATVQWYDPDAVKPVEVIDGPVMSRSYDFGDELPWQSKTETMVDAAPDVGDFYDNVAAVLQRGEPMLITPQSVREVIRVMAATRKGTPFEGNA